MYPLFLGLTAPPKNLKYTIGNDSCTLDWSPLFILASTEVKFKVVATTPDHDHSSHLLTRHLSHTFFYKTFNTSRCNSDHRLNFSVHSVNQVGESEPAFISFVVPQDISLCGESEFFGGKLSL